MTKHYPEIYCALGEGENIFAIVGRILGEMRKARIPPGEMDRFMAEVTATASYADALAVCSAWVEMPGEDDDALVQRASQEGLL